MFLRFHCFKRRMIDFLCSFLIVSLNFLSYFGHFAFPALLFVRRGVFLSLFGTILVIFKLANSITIS
jgi:hypothetical protein